MKPNFIFAQDVKAVLRDGTKKITIPQNSRISAAALDLIKENGVELTYAGSLNDQSDMAVAAPLVEQASGVSAENIGDAGPEVADEPMPEEMVEEIARRVIARFRELKGAPAVASPLAGQKLEDEDDLVICRCEEITRKEIKEAIRNGMKTLNGIKRVTRAGMGLCQGQTCQRLVTQLLAGELGMAPAQIKQMTPRAPVRPVALSVLAAG
ncbi:MAG: (2Fe-2S)-binding protein [Syntrophobacteraceae bacterium]|nr:(2Fe-2S)-binding protein [Syntrophobacteraceae bacterium]